MVLYLGFSYNFEICYQLGNFYHQNQDSSLSSSEPYRMNLRSAKEILYNIWWYISLDFVYCTTGFLCVFFLFCFFLLTAWFNRVMSFGSVVYFGYWYLEHGLHFCWGFNRKTTVSWKKCWPSIGFDDRSAWHTFFGYNISGMACYSIVTFVSFVVIK